MRHKTQKTLPLFHQFPNHPISQELQKISEILEELPEILDLVLADLSDNPRQGAGGLSAEFVLRAALIKQMFGYSYAELAFQLADSNSLRAFVRAPLEGLPKQSTLQRNIARIRDTTWQQIRCRFTQYAQEEGWEKGRQIRLDSTAVSTDIHHPSDSALLDDGVRTLTRLMGQLKERQQALHQLGEAFVEIRYRDHTRRARKLSCRIANGRGQAREKAYRELLKVARQTDFYQVFH